MNSLEASIRNTKSKGDVRSLRLNGNVPAIIYGGSEQNEPISISKTSNWSSTFLCTRYKKLAQDAQFFLLQT